MSFRNLFQKDIDKNRTPSSFSFNQTKSKIADQQQQKNPFDTNQLNDDNDNNNTIFNSNEDDNNIFYSFNNKELESREDEYQHDNDNDNGEYGDDMEEEEEADVEIEEEENIENPGDTSILNEDERRRRNIEASIRFRVRRKNKIIQLENQIISENNKIEEFKIDLHKLEIENVCLRKMLLGNWNPQDDNISDNNFSNDSNLLSSAINNSKSNFEILQLLKQTKKHL